jgi:esterase/lipase superfamily enzyme
MVLATQRIEKDELYIAVNDRLAGDTAGLLVFVHGYNVAFEDALRRTAQIAFDLQYNGIPVTYSWPSKGQFADYTVDETNAEWSQPHFQEFLTGLAQRTGAHRINIVAHSMGNRIVARTIASLSSRKDHERYGVYVLAAPDIDRDVFLQMAQALAAGARNVILYASSHDRALRASKLVHGYPRAGESDNNIAVCDGIQTVDVSALAADFTGHGYFGDNVNVVSDLYYLLRGQVPRRFRLKEETNKRGSLWRFVP